MALGCSCIGQAAPEVMKSAFVFPGQGSQSVGMGKALAERFPGARIVFDEVDAALGQHLSRLMFEGPEGELMLTANAQPALMAVSLAALRALETEAEVRLDRDASFVAGHSLGEYSALAAAGTFTLSQAARLLRLRGKAMQDAVPVGLGAMAALIGIEAEAARKLVEEAAGTEICQVANDNGGGQIVVSGMAGAVARAVEIARANGAKRAVMLQVSAPFHCALMQPAAEAMREALAAVEIKSPSVPVVANVLARPVADPDEIRRCLVAQVCGTVRWRESCEWLAGAGVTRFVEIGAGKVLSGLIKRIAPGASTLAVGSPDDVSRFEAAPRSTAI